MRGKFAVSGWVHVNPLDSVRRQRHTDSPGDTHSLDPGYYSHLDGLARWSAPGLARCVALALSVCLFARGNN